MSSESFICNDHSFLSLLPTLASPSSFWDASTPYHIASSTCQFLIILTFVASSTSENLSQVDKLWSILPAMYSLMCIVDQRTMLMALLSALWSIRLTYNFHRRGGYSWPPWEGDEDYRWEYIRRGTLGGPWKLLTNQWIMLVFNFGFISLFQNILLLFIAAPAFVAWSVGMRRKICDHDESESGSSAPDICVLDFIATILFFVALVMETVADNQQYTFQAKKYAWLSTNNNGDKKVHNDDNIENDTIRQYSDGFCQSGLFALVRKPNYAAEQFLWFSYYLFSVAASGDYFNWSGGGFVLLCILFQGSGWLTEKISISKYPKYRDYQKRVPLYVPRMSNLWLLLSSKGCGLDDKNE